MRTPGAVLTVLLAASAVKAEPYAFFVAGDSRSNPGIFEQNVATMTALDPSAIAYFNPGDITADGIDSQWATHMAALDSGSGGLFRADVSTFGPWVRYIGAVGNHDVHQSGWLDRWNANFSGQATEGFNSTAGVYFALYHDNAMFVILDTQHPGSIADQVSWLEDELLTPAAQAATWKFAFFHHPVYPCNEKSLVHHGLAFVPVFEQHAFDIVFVAHSHTYERTCPMLGGHCADGGVIYLNSSGAAADARIVDETRTGTVSYGGRSDSFDCSEILVSSYESWYHFCYFYIDGEVLDLSCYSHDTLDVTHDVFQIDKGGAGGADDGAPPGGDDGAAPPTGDSAGGGDEAAGGTTSGLGAGDHDRSSAGGTPLIGGCRAHRSPTAMSILGLLAALVLRRRRSA